MSSAVMISIGDNVSPPPLSTLPAHNTRDTTTPPTDLLYVLYVLVECPTTTKTTFFPWKTNRSLAQGFVASAYRLFVRRSMSSTLPAPAPPGRQGQGRVQDQVSQINTFRLCYQRLDRRSQVQSQSQQKKQQKENENPFAKSAIYLSQHQHL